MVNETELLSRLSKNLSDELKLARPGMAIMHTHSSPMQNVYTMLDGTGGAVSIDGNEVRVVVERLRDNAGTVGMEMKERRLALNLVSVAEVDASAEIAAVVAEFYAQPPKV